ncbi:uncharacterized protein TRAVEDRAFT_58854 [Trametes versicolor FP-101664 SS1]|uniref:uncharacterized protein n=1 Tax=Trametes versicolor (strain FP-101664) TaxID=717944 RepID=UPI0004624379|nr:uncharacterized protein TRAVEDRAFT_58854 [Trametes versicolor FP-101664 SS1]EIW58716.1 hypothetical protein TRAVEDRAFT_58854 [Trametes versicolor FP-101664 SS1]
MPLPYAHIISGGPSFPHQPQMLDEDEDDLDDICPVCESECTCPKKSAPTLASTATEPSASSTPSSAPSSSYRAPAHAGKHPLKIKLSLSKARKPPATHASARFGSATDAAPSSSRPTNKAAGAGASAPKRRGRPPKALAAVAKNATKKKVAADDMEYKARGTTGTGRRAFQPSAPVASTSTADLSDSTLSDYPTFVPAASEDTHSSSSESSDSEITSSSDDESMYQIPNDDGRQSTKLLPSHLGQRRRDRGSNNKWEIRPRKKSVGAGEEDEESSADSDDSAESSEDGDDENDEEEEEDADADVEAEGDVELTGVGEPDVELDDEEEKTRSSIGLTFPGNGWSDDEEEEESFDADLFFANLDGSSDSGASSPEEHYADLRSFASDIDLSGSFSTDEEDALLLMDLDPSVQLRRGDGEFEIGVELDNFSFGWDGQLLFTNSRMPDGLGLFGMSGPDEDTDMFSASGSDCSGSDDGSGTGTVMLQDSEGDTTEDELVDSDGLPNSRAMMLFRWPSSVSAINPLSTVNPLTTPPPNASPSTRIALASISTQRRSPPPTPADILAGKISMEDLEDIEMDKERYSPISRRRGVPVMGEFAVENTGAPKQAAIVGEGREVPSFYPRPIRIARFVEPVQENSVEDVFMSALRPPLPTESSDEAAQALSQQSYVSEPSENEAIELDDVLDSSLLDSEPSAPDCETDVPDADSQSSPMKGSHIHSLSRWDRIPMATFRRTRETATASGVDGGASDTGYSALQYRGFGGGLPLFTPPLDKMSRASARKRKNRPGHSHGASPTLSARDGMLGSPFAPAPSADQPPHSNKTKKELKKEKAMMKRKLVAKSSQYRYQQPHRGHHHSHLPNHKSRASSSVQRSNFLGSGSSIPSLTI